MLWFHAGAPKPAALAEAPGYLRIRRPAIGGALHGTVTAPLGMKAPTFGMSRIHSYRASLGYSAIHPGARYWSNTGVADKVIGERYAEKQSAATIDWLVVRLAAILGPPGLRSVVCRLAHQHHHRPFPTRLGSVQSRRWRA
jgi:hypothetical protein